MSDQHPSFLSRFFLAWAAYFRTLFDGEFASGVVKLRSGEALPAPAKAEPQKKEEPKKKKKREPKPEPVILREPTPEAACQLLGIFQREGRFIDFLREDVSSFSDEEIGAAARVVHDGCSRALDEHFTVVPVRTEEEGAAITLEEGFNASEVRMTGNVTGTAPFKGNLSHRGWKATEIKLPKMSKDHDAMIIAAAEVEV